MLRISFLLSLLIHSLFLYLFLMSEINSTIQHPLRTIDVYLVEKEPEITPKKVAKTATRTHQVRNKRSFIERESVGKSNKDLVPNSFEFIRNSEFGPVESAPVEKMPVEEMYIESWRRKVSAFGNLNYPVSRNKAEGELTLVAIILSDGNLKDVYVGKSSGQRILDNAAVYFVERTSPFAKFPEQMEHRKDITIKSVFLFRQTEVGVN